jgi:hypothetical protein
VMHPCQSRVAVGAYPKLRACLAPRSVMAGCWWPPPAKPAPRRAADAAGSACASRS